MKYLFAVLIAAASSGCANVDFKAGENGAVYYEPVPYLFYSKTDKCISSASIVSLPGNKRYLDFKSGYGSSSLSAEFSNGLLIKVGQTSDTKVPETLTSIAGLKGAAVALADPPGACAAQALLFPIENGVPNMSKAIDLSLGQ